MNIQQKRGCIVLLASLLAVVTLMVLLIEEAKDAFHPMTNRPWIVAGVAFAAPFLFFPWRGTPARAGQPAVPAANPLKGLAKVLLHLACLPLGCLPFFLFFVVAGWLGADLNKWPPIVAKVSAFGALSLALTLSYNLEAWLSWRRLRRAARRLAAGKR